MSTEYELYKDSRITVTADERSSELCICVHDVNMSRDVIDYIPAADMARVALKLLQASYYNADENEFHKVVAEFPYLVSVIALLAQR